MAPLLAMAHLAERVEQTVRFCRLDAPARASVLLQRGGFGRAAAAQVEEPPAAPAGRVAFAVAPTSAAGGGRPRGAPPSRASSRVAPSRPTTPASRPPTAPGERAAASAGAPPSRPGTAASSARAPSAAPSRAVTPASSLPPRPRTAEPGAEAEEQSRARSVAQSFAASRPRTPQLDAAPSGDDAAGLKAAFEGYAKRGSEPNTTYLAYPKFVRLVRDAGLLSEAAALADVDTAFFAAATRMPRLELSYWEFVDALNRIAVAFHPERDAADAAAAGLHAVAAMADTRAAEGEDPVREALMAREVLAKFAAAEPVVRTVFGCYAEAGWPSVDGSALGSSRLRRAGFQQLARDMGLFPQLLSEGAVMAIYEAAGGGKERADREGLNAHELMECIGRVAVELPTESVATVSSVGAKGATTSFDGGVKTVAPPAKRVFNSAPASRQNRSPSPDARRAYADHLQRTLSAKAPPPAVPMPIKKNFVFYNSEPFRARATFTEDHRDGLRVDTPDHTVKLLTKPVFNEYLVRHHARVRQQSLREQNQRLAFYAVERARTQERLERRRRENEAQFGRVLGSSLAIIVASASPERRRWTKSGLPVPRSTSVMF